MTMLEKYLMKLFTFTLYFIIIYLNVTAVNALIKRELVQKRADWDPSTSFVECHNLHDKSKHCDKRDWTEEANYRFTTEVIKTQSNLELDDCFNMCWKDENCYAVSRKKGGNKACIFLGRKYKSKYDKNYNSYIARCCTIKDPPVTPTEEPVEPPVEPVEPPVEPVEPPVEPIDPPCPGDRKSLERNLPVIVYSAKLCSKRREQYSQTTQFYDMSENTDYSSTPYQILWDVDTQTCQSICNKDKKCVAVAVLWNGKVCRLFHKLDEYVPGGECNKRHAKLIFYIKFKCQINKQFLMHKKNNLLIVSDYRPFCHEISEPTTNRCRSSFWQYLEKTRYSVSFSNGFTMTKIHDCLNRCLKNSECYAVSIDHLQRKCYLQTGLCKRVKPVPHYSMSSYKLQCCNQPKLE